PPSPRAPTSCGPTCGSPHAQLEPALVPRRSHRPPAQHTRGAGSEGDRLESARFVGTNRSCWRERSGRGVLCGDGAARCRMEETRTVEVGGEFLARALV